MGAKILKLRRFLQEPNECAVAATASVTNYYNKNITYDDVRTIANNDGDGMWTPQIGMLLNTLGFEKVTIVTADIKQLDFTWKNLSKRQLINRLKKHQRKYEDELKDVTKEYIKFLKLKRDNSIIIDVKFGKYIREHIDNNKPVLASFNWNMFFNYPKTNANGDVDPIKGDYEEHEVVIYGYDHKGVNILDSHHQFYRGKLSKYRTGRYNIDWETLHTIIGFGDIILPDNYAMV